MKNDCCCELSTKYRNTCPKVFYNNSSKYKKSFKDLQEKATEDYTVSKVAVGDL